MTVRTNQTLWTLVALLLAANLFRPLAASAQLAKSNAPAEVLRAERLELVDQKGQVRVSLRVEDDGTAVFRMFDESGAIRVKLGAAKDGSGLALLDDNTEAAVHLLAQAKERSITLSERGKDKRILKP